MSINTSIINPGCLFSELLQRIFSILTIKEIGCIGRVCKLWQTVAQDEQLWKLFCQRDLLINSLQSPSTWKETYQNFFQKDVLERIISLKKPVSETYKAFEGNLSASIVALQVRDEKAYCGSLNGNIEVWDLNQRKRAAILKEPGEQVYSLKLHDQFLFSGLNGKITVWDLISQKSLATLVHLGMIFSLQVVEGNLLSASNRGIKIWDLATKKRLRTLELGPNFFSFCIRDNILYTGTYDKIKIWDFSKVQVLDEIAHEGRVSSLQIQGKLLAAGASLETQVNFAVWDIFTKQRLLQIEDCANRVAFQFCGDLFACALLKRVEIWDVSKCTLIKRFVNRPDLVNALHLQCDRLITGSSDNVIRVWKFQSEPTFFQSVKKIIRGFKKNKERKDACQIQ